MIADVEIIWTGVKLGLILAIMAGPILFSLVQAGVESGLRAGTMVGLGVWTSDVCFILAVYFGFESMQNWVSWDAYGVALGLAGALILLVYGGIPLFSSKNKIPDPGAEKLPSAYGALWLKGFLINTINPFTVFFWISVMGAYVVAENWLFSQAIVFFGSILGVIILTDFTKVAMAKKIKTWLNHEHILLLRRISGIALILFGLILLFRVLVLKA